MSMNKTNKKTLTTTPQKSVKKNAKPSKVKKESAKGNQEKPTSKPVLNKYEDESINMGDVESSRSPLHYQVAEQSETDPYSMQKLDDAVPRKVHTISLSLLAKRCIKNYQNLTAQQIMELLNEVTHVRLDRENLHHIDGLELLDGNRVKNLYLQHNEISSIEGLETLIELKFLTLSNNKIQRIQNLKSMKLGFLDLSHNAINELDIDELPKSLVILSLDGNPCQLTDGYREVIIKHCPGLSQLDGERLTVTERRAAGHDVTSESEDSGDEGENERGGAQADYDYNKPFDAQVLGVFDDMSSDMFIRCQERIQHIYDEHKARVLNLERIKADGGIVLEDGVSNPASRMSSRFDSPDTTDSSRPATGNTHLDDMSIINGEASEDLGFRLAQMKMTNASILADRMEELSVQMTTDTEDRLSYNTERIHISENRETFSRGHAWGQETLQARRSVSPSRNLRSVRPKEPKSYL